ncbi:hypothetical protein TthSNM66_18470 [Thermus thermophilus]|nr:hypothetical protein TthSNM66_18470 [Thermus thermophilus]
MWADDLARDDLERLERARQAIDMWMAFLGERYGYEAHLGRNSVLERWEAVAVSPEGRMVGYGWGATRLEALRALAGDLGVEPPEVPGVSL